MRDLGVYRSTPLIMRAVTIRQEEKKDRRVIKAMEYCREYLERVVLQVRCQNTIKDPKLNFHLVKGYNNKKNLYVSTWWPESDSRSYKVRLYINTVEADFNVRKDISDQVADFARHSMITRLQKMYDKTYGVITIDQHELQD